MLKTTVSTNDLSIRNLVLSEDFTSDRDFYNNKLLGVGKNSLINSIVDSEIYEFKPNKVNTLNFNIFFLRYLQDIDITAITPYMESYFPDQLVRTKIGLGIIHSDGTAADRGIHNLFEIRQENNLREPTVLSDVGKLGLSVVSERPYVSTDPIGEASLKRPVKPGLPVFYNSFTFPYWDKKDDWLTNSLLYKNKPYFYNSFLMMEVYDSSSNITQKRLITIPIFVNSRYNITEKNVTTDFTYERPCFSLSEGFEGFSFFFLNNYSSGTFYVRFSFWDALNGVKIPLIPSSKGENGKKWFQDVNKFQQEALYLKYVLSYSNKVYDIYEFDLNTGNYDLERTNFDLYELAFDPYYNDVFVANIQPVDANSIPPVVEPLIPLKFSIKNLIKDTYFPPNSQNVDTLSMTISINDADSYIGNTGSLVDAYASYVTTQTTQVIGFYNFNNNLNFNIPIVNKTITGFNGVIANFNASNVDTVDWTMTDIGFENIVLATDKNIYTNNTYYNNINNSSTKVSEALVMLSNSGMTINSKFAYDLTEELYYSIDFFQYLLDQIQADRSSNIFNAISAEYGYAYVPPFYDNVLQPDGSFLYQLISGGYDDYRILSFLYNNFSINPDPIKVFLDTVFSLLNIAQPSYHQDNYFGFRPNQDNQLDTTVSELNDYIPLLVSGYEAERNANTDKYRMILAAMKILIETISSIRDNVTNYVKTNLMSGLNQQTIQDYKMVCAYLKDGLNDRDVGNINTLSLDNISQALDNTAYIYEIRDYLFDLMVVYNGSSLIKPGQNMPFQVKFNIGTKANFNFLDCQNITIKGKLKLSLLNADGVTKYIYIPLNLGLKVGNIPTTTYLSTVTNDKNYKLNV